MFLIVDNEAHYQLSGCLLGEMILIVLKGLEEVNKYYCSSPSSLQVVKLVSVKRIDSAFLFLLLAVCSLLRIQLPFECINFFKKQKESHRCLSGSNFDFKASLVLFLLFQFSNCSAISRVVVVVVTIVTPHVGPLMILRRLVYTTGKDTPFLLSTGSEARLGPLVRLIFSKFSKCLK
jgi:hypothetical protein